MARDKDRNTVDHGAAGLQYLLNIPLGGRFAADRQVVKNHIGLGIFQDFNDVGSLAGGFLYYFREILTQAVMSHTSEDLYTGKRHIGKLESVIGFSKNRLG